MSLGPLHAVKVDWVEFICIVLSGYGQLVCELLACGVGDTPGITLILTRTTGLVYKNFIVVHETGFFFCVTLLTFLSTIEKWVFGNPELQIA